MTRPFKTALIAVPAAIVLLLAGVYLGGHPHTLPSFIAKGFVDDNLRTYDEALHTIDDTYYRKLDRTTLTNDAIAGMVDKLDDRFSAYFSPSQYAKFQSAQRTEFTGIGVLVAKHPLGLRVLRVYDGSPAKRGGVRNGDVIVKAGTHSLKGLTQDKASTFVTGPPGSDVTIVVRRDGKDRTLKLTRATITAGFTESKLVDHDGTKVGVVALSQFGPGAHAEVAKGFTSLKARGATRFILDLRQNGGGLVDEARLIASQFLAKNAKIVTTKGRRVQTQTLRAIGDPLLPKQPLVVLVDRNTASASEIVTGALKDDKRATVVGTRTFGKGVFQEVIQLSNGGALDITAGQYFTPSGKNLGGKGVVNGKDVSTGAGIAPDVSASDDPKTRADEGLDKAVDVVAAEPAA